MGKEIHSLKKYMKLSTLLDILNRKQITLLSPQNWPDKNDSFVMEKYRDAKNAAHVCAICFTVDTDSVYHWTAFSKECDGCCLELDAESFLKSIETDENVKHQFVRYLPVTFKDEISIDDYPFVKRKQFECEREYRLVVLNDESETYPIDLKPEFIRRISISDDMPKPVCESVKKIIKDLCPDVEVCQTTLNDNNKWKKHFE